MERNIVATVKPPVMFRFVGLEIIKNDMCFSVRVGISEYFIHKIHEFYPSAPLRMFHCYLASLGVEGSKERGRSMPFIFVGESSKRFSMMKSHISLCTPQCLYAGFSSTEITSVPYGGAR